MISFPRLLFFTLFFLQVNRSACQWQGIQANISVWLSAAAYCEKSQYPTMKLAGAAAGFELSHVLYNRTSDLQGFVGVLHEYKTIYTVFRGTHSVRNWIKDIEIRQTVYSSLPECGGAIVHSGFYDSALGITQQTHTAIGELHKKYGYNRVIITGHSYGAAISILMGMELITNAELDISVYNFGQPRVGDINFTKCVNYLFDDNAFRVIHDRDIVPHLPTEIHYTHSCREIFEMHDGALSFCSENECEDSKCASQYSMKETTIEDHYVYLGHEMTCETSIFHKN
jgi:hypothetical protein